MSAVKVTKPQEKLLRRIVETNGGGISSGFGGMTTKMIMRLHEKGLVQGKLGNPQLVVHTREGLELIRSLDDALLSQRSETGTGS